MRRRGMARILACAAATLIGCAPHVTSHVPADAPTTEANRHSADAPAADANRHSADAPTAVADRLPNIVVITSDDLGYGDLSCYGSRSIRTPVLDQLGKDGVRLTSFVTASPVCSPSRAALLTGRYSVRTGVVRALGPADSVGIPPDELTIAEALRARGYVTGMVGKWHVGHTAEFLPPSQGFDFFFGMPYSSDTSPTRLLRGMEVVDENVDVASLTERYTAEAVAFIDAHADRPFLLYLAHSAPHVPLLVTDRFRGKSAGGRYGDAVESVDWSVGEILEALRRHGVDANTLVLFTSDNGPWGQGSAGGLRGRKGSPFEGGFRVPFVARWSGHIPAGLVSDEPVSSLDLFPTFLAAAGASPPADLLLDGADVLPFLTGRVPRRPPTLMIYFVGEYLRAARYERWKLHVSRPRELPSGEIGRENVWLVRPELFDLERDPDESYDVAEDHADVVKDLKRRIRERAATLPEAVRSKNLPLVTG